MAQQDLMQQLLQMLGAPNQSGQQNLARQQIGSGSQNFLEVEDLLEILRGQLPPSRPQPIDPWRGNYPSQGRRSTDDRWGVQGQQPFLPPADPWGMGRRKLPSQSWMFPMNPMFPSQALQRLPLGGL